MRNLSLAKVTILAAFLAFTSLSFAADDPAQEQEQSVMLDINSADAATIAAALDGIGLVKAQEIVAYRESFGKFESVEELAEVKGIGSATIEKNRNKIVIVKN